MTATMTTERHLALQLFPGYTGEDTKIFAEFTNAGAKPEPGFVVDFLGSRIRASSLWKEGRALDGQLLPIPLPADFHAEAVEWIGLLKSVRSASGQYVAMELGAGFGPWIVAGGAAARLRGIKDVRLCAVEGDPERFRFLRQHLTDNGFDPDRQALFEAAVGTKAGVAEWPVIGTSSAAEVSGCRPLWDAGESAEQPSHGTKKIPVVAMSEIVVREPRWDLVHIDVQGDEVDICRSCLDDLSARVCRIVVGTHSRKIDGDFLELMWRAGWVLEHEKPARFLFNPNSKTLEGMTTVDGTQVWRNPRLLPQADRVSSFSQEITSPIDEFRVKSGTIHTIDLNVKNTGTENWIGGGQPLTVAASYRWVDSESKVLSIEGNRAHLGRAAVQPGETDSLQLQVLAPPNPGSYTLLVSMVQEGVSWFIDRGAKPLIVRVEVD